MSVPYAVSIPTFIGSFCSCTASAFVLICYAVLPPQKHFRHALIVNLLVADFLNALCNTVSGGAVLHNDGRQLTAGPACTANGLLTQLTVQTVDFSIIAISIVVLCTVKQTRFMDEPSTWKATLLCTCIWLPGITTSLVALRLRAYGPVSGNWCWIRKELLLERYVLTHGWRIAIFFTTIAIYVYIYLHLRRVYGSLTPFPHHTTDNLDDLSADHPSLELRFHSAADLFRASSLTLPTKTSISAKSSVAPISPALLLPHAPTPEPPPQQQHPNTHVPDSTAARRREIKRMLLLNGYPAMYIILWIPGIVNRVVESTAGRSPLWLTALQASTQFVGVANAVTYGYNEGLKRQIVVWWGRRRRKERREGVGWDVL